MSFALDSDKGCPMGCPLDGQRVASAPIPIEEVTSLWTRYRAGEIVKCPRSGSPFAVSVEGTTAVYRIGCTECGMSSTWFEPTKDGIIERGERDADDQTDP